jgi:Helicase conserved C-terminal domain
MSVQIDDREAVVAFGTFAAADYDLFLRCKRLPESTIAFDWERSEWTIRTPARFASLLGEQPGRKEAAQLPLADHLFDYQRFIVRRALEARRYAVWADTGLGKTAMFLEWARHVTDLTQAPVLILSPLQVIPQTIDEARRFYGDDLPIQRLETREALSQWCESGSGLAMCNYEKLIPGVIPELRRLGGLVLDESSILKTGGGVIKWNLIKSARGIEYKLSCTATPAPNDAMEYASQAAFLEKLRNEGEILWTFFRRDKRGNWVVKPHAVQAFYTFMASWSIFLRDPAHYGWQDVLSTLPPADVREYRLEMTEQQVVELQALQIREGLGMFSSERMGVKQRAKQSQMARGFLYEDKAARRLESLKPAHVVGLVRDELAAGHQVLVWTVFDEEARILQELLGEVATVLDGSTPLKDRPGMIEAFRAGTIPCLISKSQLLGYGLNFQHVEAMVFSGFDDSFERMYQAIRRVYRFGQTKTVRVHIPYIPELEGMVFDNVRSKESRFEEEASACERHYRATLQSEVAA